MCVHIHMMDIYVCKCTLPEVQRGRKECLFRGVCARVQSCVCLCVRESLLRTCVR